VAAPFWMMFGLIAGLAGSTLLRGCDGDAMGGQPAWQKLAASAAALAIAAAHVVARPELRPVESRAVNGLYEWETGADGFRFRWTGEYAGLFVPSDVTRVYVPVRMPAVGGGLSPMVVEAKTTGAPGQRSRIGEQWAILNLELPDAVPPQRFKRINIH